MANKAQKARKSKNGTVTPRLSLVKDERPKLPPVELIHRDLIEADCALVEAREALCTTLSALTEEQEKPQHCTLTLEFTLEMLLSLNKHMVAVQAACNSARRRAYDLSQGRAS